MEGVTSGPAGKKRSLTSVIIARVSNLITRFDKMAFFRPIK